MRILVTGHLGYIGVVLTPMLSARGHDVVGLDSDLFQGCTFAGDIPRYPNLGLDLRAFCANQEQAVDTLSDFDAVIHLAGLSNDPLGDYRPSLTHDLNAVAAITLAQHAKHAGVSRFLFASSCSNYGAAGEEFIDEQGALNPVTPYGKSKAAAEVGVRALADENFSPTFLRASTAHGMSPRIRFDLVVNNLAAWAFASGQVLLKSDGMSWRPLVHVEDIAHAYTVIVESARELVHNRSFNIGQTSENFRVRDVAEIVRDVIPGSNIRFSENAGPDKRNYRVNCDLIARTLPAWKPQWTVQRSVEQLYEAFQSHNITVDEFEGDRFKRIDHIKRRIADGELTPDLYVASREGAIS